jgi:nicotinamidase-related amidase
MDALIVVDMQVGLLNGEPKHDLRGVIERINRLAAKVRERSGVVIFGSIAADRKTISSRAHRAGRFCRNSSARCDIVILIDLTIPSSHRPRGAPERDCAERVLITDVQPILRRRYRAFCRYKITMSCGNGRPTP